MPADDTNDGLWSTAYTRPSRLDSRWRAEAACLGRRTRAAKRGLGRLMRGVLVHPFAQFRSTYQNTIVCN